MKLIYRIKNNEEIFLAKAPNGVFFFDGVNKFGAFPAFGASIDNNELPEFDAGNISPELCDFVERISGENFPFPMPKGLLSKVKQIQRQIPFDVSLVDAAEMEILSQCHAWRNLPTFDREEWLDKNSPQIAAYLVTISKAGEEGWRTLADKWHYKKTEDNKDEPIPTKFELLFEALPSLKAIGSIALKKEAEFKKAAADLKAVQSKKDDDQSGTGSGDSGSGGGQNAKPQVSEPEDDFQQVSFLSMDEIEAFGWGKKKENKKSKSKKSKDKSPVNIPSPGMKL